MLIRFRVSNFLSFKDEVEFSMIPGRSRQHPHHIISGGSGRNDTDLLRAGVVYGANASGKSNLIHVLGFTKALIMQGVKARKSISVTPFKLDKNSLQQPSRFEFEIRCGEKDYLYGFELDSEKIYSEWLHHIKKTTTAPIFERKVDDNKKTSIVFNNLKFETKKDEEFLEFVARGTRTNQLFLSESIDREVTYFEDVYNWFDKLVLIYPETRHQMDLNVNNERTKAMVKYLERVGTGVCGFGLQSIHIEAELPQELIDDVTKELKPDDKTVLMNHSDGQRYLISRTPQGELITEKFMLKHKMMDCNDGVLFDTDEESDGTIRLMDILPIVTTPDSAPMVYVIDELDRSLHPNLCYQLIEDFLAIQNNSQLIVTTHEANLLNLELLRRDEIWFVEKNKQGATITYSLEEFTPRYDKDVQKGYLLGRFGAIPIIGKKAF
ncbi:MAG TPA: ATP/GTP-binding protein [Anaerolineales bacterium]|nr:ATP/GTP-binding protein [Anaerolineales bacterium]